MTPSEIIEIDAKNNGYGLTAQELEKMIIDMNSQGWRPLQDQDALFLFKPIDDKGTVEFNILVGKESTAKTSCLKFFKLLKRIGANKAVCEYKNPELTDVFKSLGSSYSPSFGKKNDELTMKVRL